MADGEERTTLRPLRPATPRTDSGGGPDGPATGLPRPRRPWLSSGKPADDAAPDPPPTDPVPAEAIDNAAGTTSDATTPDRTDATAAESTPKTTVEESTPESGAPAARRRRVRFGHAVRLPGPRAAARATRAWSRRPSGRLTLPGVFLLVLVAATATAGALLVPATLGAPRPVAVDATADPLPSDLPPSGQVPPPGQFPPPTATLPPGVTPPGTAGPAGGRPSDALAGWARDTGAKVGIDPIAMQAYGYAELVLAETDRACGLSWTTLAAIGLVESRHGQANNAQLGADGRAVPEIIGLPLDGQGNRMRIADTDRGELDRDTTYDRAIGPMQFIPTTWEEIGADADNDGRKDPHNIHDAALAAGMYLCKGGRNLTIPGDWWNAILSYNDVRRYAQDVFDAANRYGQASRT
ncbi:lytic transglycosylase domain-containing protein [Verrucosispora sp. WMMA2044]|uniref:lytic transglycosylase domain-containing protein n=1 Tax=Verrucosispora sp. WMMA2044 TaxID=3016419 RepID=UPI00248C6837|nr:lytic transglycosylase domain-containing protein [Verrucosispora sp. WMMA2044]WBB48949.1 lytic transglycosylase domain-containing protein [Verrucosispora sp. WMMA2044]WBB48972.1 lytic transglycosylase domain-containing protein [Verrucosispora sp. WMMA2044]